MRATDEYRKLLEEKKRIDARLKELQHKRALFGTVKLEMHRWASYGREAYNVMIKKHSGMINSENDRFYTIIEDFDRKHSMERLKQIIDDLGILLEYLKEEEACEDSDE